MEFKQAVVTQNGRALMAKLLAGKSTQFTKIKVSSTIYPDAQLANLTALTNIKQEAPAQAYGNNTATVSVVGAIENTGLATGYYINTVGLYAVDPDKGEILYSVSSASVNGYMPPDTGVSKSGFEFKIYTEVGNATQVDLTVDPAAFATHEDIERLEVHQAWMVGENGQGFSNNLPNPNVVVDYSGGIERKADGSWTDAYRRLNETFITENFSGKALNFGVRAEVEILRVDDDAYNGTPFYFVFTLQLSGRGGPLITVINKTISTCEVGDKLIFTQTLKNFTFGVVNNCRTPLKFDAGNRNVVARITALSFVESDEEPTACLPAPTDDPINCYPKYVGFGIKLSDNYQDYRWILNPDWVNANAIYGTAIVTMQDQLADIQDWIQAHS